MHMHTHVHTYAHIHTLYTYYTHAHTHTHTFGCEMPSTKRSLNFCTPAKAVFPFENCDFRSHRPLKVTAIFRVAFVEKILLPSKATVPL